MGGAKEEQFFFWLSKIRRKPKWRRQEVREEVAEFKKPSMLALKKTLSLNSLAKTKLVS